MGGCMSTLPQKHQINQRKQQQVKLTCLVYSLPDSGQRAFVRDMERIFSNISPMSSSPFEAIEISSTRSARPSWSKKLFDYPKVICVFLCVNVQTQQQANFSALVTNWIYSEFKVDIPFLVIVNSKTLKDKIGLETFKKEVKVSPVLWSESNQTDQQKILDFIQNSASKFNNSLEKKK